MIVAEFGVKNLVGSIVREANGSLARVSAPSIVRVLGVVGVCANVDCLVYVRLNRHALVACLGCLDLKRGEIGHLLILHVRVAHCHHEVAVEGRSIGPPLTIALSALVLKLVANSAPGDSVIETIWSMVGLVTPRVAHLNQLGSIAELLRVEDGVGVIVGDADIVLVLVATRASLAGSREHPVVIESIMDLRPQFVDSDVLVPSRVVGRSSHRLDSGAHPAALEHLIITE
mmetsp:Transcript_27814/g.37147  ORF Transcript_27814/g.37147 Transcript_27814/m.37147 type:complete len:230 (+) Transcript_27814:679-1368(+)